MLLTFVPLTSARPKYNAQIKSTQSISENKSSERWLTKLTLWFSNRRVQNRQYWSTPLYTFLTQFHPSEMLTTYFLKSSLILSIFYVFQVGVLQ